VRGTGQQQRGGDGGQGLDHWMPSWVAITAVDR
jgi:hypothetical protein